MNITGIGRQKKSVGNHQKIQQIVVCPNCQYHFKVTHFQVPFIPQKNKAISEQNMHQSYEKVSLQNSRQYIVDWKQIPISKLSQKSLIKSIKSNQFSTIQKLQKLNDLNQLKKSRLINQRKTNAAFPQIKSSSPQRQKLSVPEQNTQRSNSVQPTNKHTKQTFLQLNSLLIIDQRLQKNEVTQLTHCLLQWIQNFDLLQTLPSFLKQMIYNYKLQQINQKHFTYLSPIR